MKFFPVLLSSIEILCELRPEVRKKLQTVGLSIRDIIQGRFPVCRIADIPVFREVMNQGIDCDIALFCRNQRTFDRLDILSLDQSRNRLSIGGRTSDSVLLPEFDDFTFIVTARSLRKVLFLIHLDRSEEVSFLNGIRNLALFLLLFFGFFIIDSSIAIKESLRIAAIESVSIAF